MSSTADRAEPRMVVDTGGISFVGTREDLSDIFEYVLRDVSGGGVGLFLRDGAPGIEHVLPGERVNFHLPFKVNEAFQDLGVIRWRRRSAEDDGWDCGASLEGRIPLYYAVYVDFDEGRMDFRSGTPGLKRLHDILMILVKDAWLLKRGIAVYFDHLAPYFRRLGKGRAQNEGREFADAMREQIAENVRRLDALRERVTDPEIRYHPENWGLEEFRVAVTPELKPEEFYERFRTTAVLPYLQSIKRLEYRLYTNFNTAVLLAQEQNHRSLQRAA